MPKKMLKFLSFKERYFFAAIVYFGLALILSSILPSDVSQIHAQNGSCSSEFPCPEGQQCCNNACIPAPYLCCDDGSSGPATNSSGQSCGCVSCCSADCSDESNCTSPPTATYKCCQ